MLLETSGVWLGIDWLVIQGIATGATAVLLLISLRYAHKQVTHARQLRDDQIRPYVVADIEPAGARPMVDFAVRNIGATAAYELRIESSPPFETTFDDTDYALNDTELIVNGVPTLPPGGEIRTLFDSMPAREDASLPGRYEVTLSYEDRGGFEHSDRYVIDLRVISGLMYVGVKTTHDAAESLESIASTLGSWTYSLHGLRVFTEDRERYAWRNGHLIHHPNPMVKIGHKALKAIGFDLHPRARRERRRRIQGKAKRSTS